MLKTGTDFNSSLLGAGTTDAKPMLLSLPVTVDPAVPDYSGVVVDQRAVVSATGQVTVAASETPVFQQRQRIAQGHMAIRPCCRARQQDWAVHRLRRRFLSDGGWRR